jgi:hypothetical protein
MRRLPLVYPLLLLLVVAFATPAMACRGGHHGEHRDNGYRGHNQRAYYHNSGWRNNSDDNRDYDRHPSRYYQSQSNGGGILSLLLGQPRYPQSRPQNSAWW